jgi:hypothetical protein
LQHRAFRDRLLHLADDETARVVERILRGDVTMVQQFVTLIPTITNEMMVTPGDPVPAR